MKRYFCKPITTLNMWSVIQYFNFFKSVRVLGRCFYHVYTVIVLLSVVYFNLFSMQTKYTIIHKRNDSVFHETESDNLIKQRESTHATQCKFAELSFTGRGNAVRCEELYSRFSDQYERVYETCYRNKQNLLVQVMLKVDVFFLTAVTSCIYIV